MSGIDRRTIGRQAEDLALDYLRAHGLDLEKRNFNCSGGEIDLIMRDGDTRVFVEVRYRSSLAFGHPGATVDAAKQRRIAIAASRYLLSHDERPCRFDVLTLSGRPPCIEWIRNAFEVQAWRT